VDWQCIQTSNFSKNDGDFDRPRRYQAEFLVKSHVPFSHVESLNTFNNIGAKTVQNFLIQNNYNLTVNVQSQYYF
jgi:ssDNA thymidine ADP-ribosyltransferase, DarT